MKTPSKLVMSDGRPVDPASVAAPAMEKTEGGILVPEGTVEKKRRVIPNADWKTMRRGIKMWGQVYGLMTMLICTKCNTTMKPSRTEKAMECKCTKFEFPGFVPVEETDVKDSESQPDHSVRVQADKDGPGPAPSKDSSAADYPSEGSGVPRVERQADDSSAADLPARTGSAR